ncbi:flagellar hook-associated protein FlgL [Actinotalea subterranea]|uniref:flagellar hook-associated protein FlgL n=1 Tax=Actinotalea subterranea TaxID=2607497 RepID=UPI0011EE30C0|nr:flagellar hook-associated protein FlgL [Actinotalea subterranea]
MINRVTHQTVQRSTLANLQLNLSKMADLQSRMSGGKIITKPSDDPAGTAQAMALRTEKRAAEQFTRNADNGATWLNTIDTALSSSTALLLKARNLTVQGANSGAMGPAAREAIAKELDGLRDALLDQANTDLLGRSVFAGTSNAGVAYTVTPAVPEQPGPPVVPAVPAQYTWTGSANGSVERRLAQDTTVRVDADGKAAFGDGATSVFALIDTIAADLRAGTDVSVHLDTIDARRDAMLGEAASVGTRYNQIATAKSNLSSDVLALKTQLSAVEDIDLAAIIVEIQAQEVAYKGALGATARVLQPTLMDFLR